MAPAGAPLASNTLFLTAHISSQRNHTHTHTQNRYCAELVAACLQAGGLMSADSNPGAATPHSLYKMYKAQGAVMANPCTLRQQFGTSANFAHRFPHPAVDARHGIARPLGVSAPTPCVAPQAHRMSDALPQIQFKVLQARKPPAASRCNTISLSMSSLIVDKRV